MSAVIDIGTNLGGHCILLRNDYKKNPMRLSEIGLEINPYGYSLPCLLFTKDKVLDSISYHAEFKYDKLEEQNQHKDWYFFRSFLSSIFNNLVRTFFRFVYQMFNCLI